MGSEELWSEKIVKMILKKSTNEFIIIVIQKRNY